MPDFRSESSSSTESNTITSRYEYVCIICIQPMLLCSCNTARSGKAIYNALLPCMITSTGESVTPWYNVHLAGYTMWVAISMRNAIMWKLISRFSICVVAYTHNNTKLIRTIRVMLCIVICPTLLKCISLRVK